MIKHKVNCNNCKYISNGEVVDYGWRLQLHCPKCAYFIMLVAMNECDDFIIQYGKYIGYSVSELSESKKGKWYIENVLLLKYRLKDWQVYVINLYI